MTTNTPGPIEVIRGQADYWRERAAMALDGMRKCERDYMAKSKSLTEAADLLGECLGLLEECIDSLEYVNKSHPEATGWAVRNERIEKAKAAIAKGRAK